MTWGRFSDTWAEQPRVEALSDAAVAVFVAGVCYSARHLTDGQIPTKKARTLRAVADPEAVVAELLAAEFWLDRGATIEIADWEAEHLLPAAEVKRQRARKAKNMADWRARRNLVTGNAIGNEPGQLPRPRPAPPRNNVKGGRGVLTAAPGGASFGPPRGVTPAITGLDDLGDEDDEEAAG